MIRLGKPVLPKDVYVAFSGGIDSVAGLSFLATRCNVTILHIDHGDEAEVEEAKVVHHYSELFNLPYEIHGGYDKRKAKVTSKECAWRNFRYSIFESMSMPVVTCHHLDDCVESWIFSCMHGNPAIIHPVSGNVRRPFLLNTKEDMMAWVLRRELRWAEDVTNADPDFGRRNYIRNTMMPHVLHLNPGIRKVVRKMVLESYGEV